MAPARQPPQPFAKDEKVLCFHGEMLYEAKILDIQTAESGEGFQYRIHYKGWKNTWDDWVSIDRIRKFTEENKELASQLHAQMKDLRQKSSAKAPKKGARANGTDSARGSEERTAGVAASGRGPRRARDFDLEQQVVEENENEGEEKDCDYRRPESSTDEEEEDYVYRRQQWLVGAGSPSIGEDDWAGYAEDGEAESSQPAGLRDSENDTSSHFEIDPHNLLRELEGRNYRVADEYSGYDGVCENVLRRAAVQDDYYDGDCEDNESWWYDDMNDNEVLDDNAYRHDEFLEHWGAVDWHQEPRQREDAPISPRTRAGTPGSPASVVNDWNDLSDSSDSSVEFLFECQAWDSSTNSSGSSIGTQLSSFSDTSKRERSESLEALQDSVQVDSLRHAVIHRESNKRKREDRVELLFEFERNEDSFHARPSIKLPIPDHIKAMLVDDWENITKNNQLVPLPHPHPVDEILNDYLAFEKPNREDGSANMDILEEVLAGLREYFEKSLSRILLYRFERPQYHEIRKEWEKAGENDKNKSVCDTYGSEHLCRLMVSLPELVAQTNMDSQSVGRLREELSKFTVWLGKHAKNYFVSEYETPSQEYIDKARGF
ncbi:Chromatin modification-related protein eaf3 [Colletotrichum sp. SAR 10_96]|nr:Chromatin modification-related protein eaf3 [Colletotrichum sp. SAR 10_96]